MPLMPPVARPVRVAQSVACMNLTDIRYARFNSSLARHLLGLFYRPGGVYGLRFGPLRGLRMRYHPSVNFHAILGIWDAETFDLLDKLFVRSNLLAKDASVVDVGANIGYYTMWLCTFAVTQGRVYSFEPSPDAVKFLRDNLKLNGIANADIVEAACGDRVGTGDFFLAHHHHSSSLHAKWAGGDQANARRITVPITTLDAFFAPETARRAPSFIKFDIEGGGTYALPGCRRIFCESRPFILIESHTPDEDKAISNVLRDFSYFGYRLNDKRWVEKPYATHPDKDGVWGTLLLIPSERCTSVATVLEKSAPRPNGYSPLTMAKKQT
jgi:FkbM family methyltransferase